MPRLSKAGVPYREGRYRWPQERFWAKISTVNGTGHWLWKGALSRGHGQFGLKGQIRIPAHRFAYMDLVGDPGDLMVLHKCQVLTCVKPEHLYLGTAQDNMNDRVRDGNCPRGESHVFAKLKDADIPVIRASALKISALARQYNVSAATIRQVKSGKSWRHVS